MDLTTEQAENATLIAAIGVSRGLPARAVSIALATAYQESKIRNLTHGDRDSLGLFQQRPSQGWGTEEQVRDPYYATNAFYDALAKIPDYKDDADHRGRPAGAALGLPRGLRGPRTRRPHARLGAHRLQPRRAVQLRGARVHGARHRRAR